MASPLHQFKIEPIVPLHIGGVDVSFTNSALFMMLALVVSSGLLFLAVRKKPTADNLIPTRLQVVIEQSYQFVANMVESNSGAEAKKYLPFVFSLFFFILIGNLLGLLPYSFTFTSHIFVTFVMAGVIFIFVTLLGFAKHGFKFLSLFVPPKGTPAFMFPLMIPIEFISYLSRPISLSVRLFANMMVGHAMMKIFASFVIPLAAMSFGIAGLLPITVNVVLVGFEIMVAFLQAYVFCFLTCLYINDALHLHH
ncbi:MAG: F0F1 ATP synthase subunit A [Hydrotalea sp.]|nr:F0F1 ATP synthase subunit A [Hydrotalea sp.]